MLPALAKAARTLGPKGLMPNPKRGSVTAEIGDAVRRAKGGEVTFAANKHAVVRPVVTHYLAPGVRRCPTLAPVP